MFSNHPPRRHLLCLLLTAVAHRCVCLSPSRCFILFATCELSSPLAEASPSLRIAFSAWVTQNPITLPQPAPLRQLRHHCSSFSIKHRCSHSLQVRATS